VVLYVELTGAALFAASLSKRLILIQAPSVELGKIAWLYHDRTTVKHEKTNIKR
jgi:hypothetical protein